MADELGRYCGEVIKRERVKDMKYYFVQSDNPEFRYFFSDGNQHRFEEDMYKRRRAVETKMPDAVGFALVWDPDVIVGTVRKDLRGFGISSYNFEGRPNAPGGMDCHFELGPESQVSNLCQMNAEIIGAESEILRKSKTKKQYLSKWCLQSRFEQHHHFKL